MIAIYGCGFMVGRPDLHKYATATEVSSVFLYPLVARRRARTKQFTRLS